MPIIFESTIVTIPLALSSYDSASGSRMDMNEGIWSSYTLRAAADGMFGLSISGLTWSPRLHTRVIAESFLLLESCC